MRLPSFTMTLERNSSPFFSLLIFAFLFLNIADLLSIYFGIFKLRASYAFTFLLFPFIFARGHVISKKFLWGFFAFSLLCVASIFNSSIFWRSFFYYLQEIYILAGCFFIASWLVRFFPIKKVLFLYLGVYIVIAFHGLFQFIAPFLGVEDPFISQKIGTFFNRPNSVCLEPAYFSYYLSFIVSSVGVYFAVSSKVSKQKKMLLFVLSLSSLFSMTTTALVQYIWIFSLCIAMGLLFRKKIPFAAILPLLAAGCIYVGAIFMSPILAWPVVGKFIEEDGSLTSGPDVTRVELATASWEYFKKHPLFGYSYGGLGPLVYAQLINEHAENLDTLEGSDFWDKDPQPIPFQLLASFGIIGILGFVVAAFLFVKRGILAYRITRKAPQNILSNLNDLQDDLNENHLVLASIASLSSIIIGGVWMMGPLIPALWVHLGLCYGLWSKICAQQKLLCQPIANT